MFNLPNVDGLMDGFRKDIDRMQTELTAIRGLLERLVALEEQK